MRHPKSITIIGRDWFSRSSGNTYCTAQIIVDGKTVHRTLSQCGCGDYSAQLACDWLEDNKFIPKRVQHNNGMQNTHWAHIRDDLGIAYEYISINVECERDL